MRQFIKRALRKVEKLNAAEVRDLLMTASDEISRLETVIDSLTRGVLVADSEHKLVLANKAGRRLLSISTLEQGRETIWNVIPDETVATSLRRALISGDKIDGEDFSVGSAGMERLLSVSVMPMVHDRRVQGALVMVDDVTDRRRAEANRRRLESLATLTTLAAGIAHEIKNPLGALSIHVQLLTKMVHIHRGIYTHPGQYLDGEGGEETDEHRLFVFFTQTEKYLKVIDEEIERLNAIVVDFLFAVRPVDAHMRRGSINAVVKEISDFVKVELDEKHIDLVINLDENISGIDFDHGLMKQALLNIVQNAESAMSQGGSLSISTADRDDEVFVIVADSGVGIPEENLSKIFEPYFTTKESGTGLGLTVLFKIVKEHGGEVIVSSRVGKGTVFTIALPKPQTGRRLIGYGGTGG